MHCFYMFLTILNHRYFYLLALLFLYFLSRDERVRFFTKFCPLRLSAEMMFKRTEIERELNVSLLKSFKLAT